MPIESGLERIDEEDQQPDDCDKMEDSASPVDVQPVEAPEKLEISAIDEDTKKEDESLVDEATILKKKFDKYGGFQMHEKQEIVAWLAQRNEQIKLQEQEKQQLHKQAAQSASVQSSLF